MPTLPPYRRILLLTEGLLGVFTSKTAAALLRYRSPDIVGIVDSVAAGRQIASYVPWAADVPIVASLAEASSLVPDALFIGIAPVGGALPDDMRRHVEDALEAGIDVVSGLHAFLADDLALASRAAQTSARLLDVRRPPADRVVASARAAETRCRRVLTVGTDGNVGKMVTSLELTAAARARGLDAEFIGTGQTGIMIAGSGTAIDACVADFASGAVEQLVLAAADRDICFIEGQGSIAHPGFSPVTLALLHGAIPQAMVLVHRLGRSHYRAPPHSPLPSLGELIAGYEQAAGWLRPARVVAVALNTFGTSDEASAAARRRLEAEFRLPVADPLRDGCEELLEAVLRGVPGT